MLRRYANEDITVGSWMVGLDVEYVDERRMCCASADECATRVSTDRRVTEGHCCCALRLSGASDHEALQVIHDRDSERRPPAQQLTRSWGMRET